MKPACRTSARRLNRRDSHDAGYAECHAGSQRRGMIEEMLLALLASPQLAVFFEKFPRLKNIIAADIPRWREAVRARLKETPIPPELDVEVQNYQRSQLLSTSQFIVQLPQILASCISCTRRLPPRRNSWWMTMRPSRPHYIPCFTALASESGGAGNHTQPAAAG